MFEKLEFLFKFMFPDFYVIDGYVFVCLKNEIDSKRSELEGIEYINFEIKSYTDLGEAQRWISLKSLNSILDEFIGLDWDFEDLNVIMIANRIKLCWELSIRAKFQIDDHDVKLIIDDECGDYFVRVLKRV